jgi:hypothetical protein
MMGNGYDVNTKVNGADPMSAPADIQKWMCTMLIDIHTKLTRLEERLIPLVEKAEGYIAMTPMERLRAGLKK